MAYDKAAADRARPRSRLRRCRTHPNVMAARRARRPVLPPPTPAPPILKLMRVLRCSHTIATRALHEGFTITQADRWATHHDWHPTRIWGRLWTDIGLIDDATWRRDCHIAAIAAADWSLSETFTAHIRHVQQTHRSN